MFDGITVVLYVAQSQSISRLSINFEPNRVDMLFFVSK